MLYHFVSGEGEGLRVTNASNAVFSSTAGTYDSALCRGAFKCDANGTISAVLETAVTDYWLSFDLYATSTTTSTNNRLNTVTLKNSAGTDLVRFFAATNIGQFAFQYWNGTSWVTIGSEVVFNGSTLDRYTIHVKRHATDGVVELYRNGTLLQSFTGNTEFIADTGLKTVVFSSRYNANTSFAMYYSQVLITDGDNRSKKVALLYATGAGTYSEMTGTYTDVNESYDGTDASVITSETADQRMTFATSDLSGTTYTDWQVEALVTVTRGQHNGVGPQNLKHMIRTGGVDYESADVSNLSTVFARQQAVWDVNPNTGQRFTHAEINAIEIGVKSVA